jgi:hypothetical protein
MLLDHNSPEDAQEAADCISLHCESVPDLYLWDAEGLAAFQIVSKKARHLAEKYTWQLSDKGVMFVSEEDAWRVLDLIDGADLYVKPI